MTARQAITFVKRHGIVLESARVRGRRSLADAVAGAPVRGNWWNHPKRKAIFWVTRAVRDSKQVLVCRLIDGRVTYVHRRLWPALVRLAPDIGRRRLDAVVEMHTRTGQHVMRLRRFPIWVDAATKRAAKRLTPETARRTLGEPL
ncbi:MAG TPA: hypothetical protein VEU08_10595 [Vicinamibacterales bacterium]|nr:hypothetical protein [Vicinamibacterales bacterium]